jgi:hypothetical protein
MPSGTLSATGINNSGVVVGGYAETLFTGPYHGFIRDTSGTLKLYDYPGATATALNNINNNGVITGTATIPPGSTSMQSHQVSFKVDLQGNVTPVSLPPPYDQAVFTIYGINDNGFISGVEFIPASGESAFILSPAGTITLVPGPGDIYSPLGSLNNSLQLMEFSANGPFGYTDLHNADGTLIPIAWDYPAPAVGNATAQGLNNGGEIVGIESDNHAGGPPFVAFMRDSSGNYSEMVCPNSSPFAILPNAVNDAGVVVGSTPGAGAFIATPVLGLAEFNSTASSLVFPAPPPGQPEPVQTITISNSGNADMDIASTRFYGYPGHAASYFTVSGCVDPVTGYGILAPGASCVLSVSVTPQFPGGISDRLIIDDSSPGAPHVIAVSATGPVAMSPYCSISSIVAGPPKQINVVVQATTGLEEIFVSDSSNTTVTVPPFTLNTTSPVNVNATKIDQSQTSAFTLVVSAVASQQITCDPLDFTLTLAGTEETHIFRALKPSEHYIRVTNGNPGLPQMTFLVNGTPFEINELEFGATRVLDVGSAMKSESAVTQSRVRSGLGNRVELKATGVPGESASVLIGDVSVAGGVN